MARRILLADDSVTAQNMGRRILTDAGYEVVTVNNGSAALKKIAELKPDLIVLDVYMPGYGGLEVCQRVKENPETRPIPVLLTVGKLEPFKAEEARRVGADAFIIKPFEATELLTVLTKLEDKIVAQPQPQKSGRFAKALAAVQQSDTGDRFGDKETGWKNRLTIPTPGAKPKPEEEAPEIVAATSVGSEPRGLEQRPEQRSEQRPEQPEAIKPVEAPQGFERPIPAGLPVDITPEEIAAITAAAASFGVKAEQVSAIPESPTQDAALNHAVQSSDVVSQEATASQRIEAETSAAPEASAPQTSHEVQVAAPAEAVSAAVIGAQAARAEDHQARRTKDRQAEDRQTEDRQTEARVTEARAEDTELPAAVVNAETTVTSELQISVPAQPAPGDAEVMAAIASLAPTNGHGIESFQSGGDGSNGAGHGVPASAVATEIVSGPRWIAEPVEVGLEESKVALDQEMELAHVSRGSTEAASVSAVTEAISSNAVSVIEQAVAEQTAEPMGPSIAAQTSVGEYSTATESASAAMATEASIAESQVSESQVVDSTIVESGVVDASTVQNQGPAVAAQGSAYAAAASAGAGAEHVASIEAVAASPIAPENSAAVQAESAPQREAELAAAWQNWKQIRESFVGSQPPVASEASAEPDFKHEETTSIASASADTDAEPMEAEATVSDAPEESTAIASIVDTMLAELRPKLVEEIAKKMNSEKKEKDRKKKK